MLFRVDSVWPNIREIYESGRNMVSYRRGQRAEADSEKHHRSNFPDFVEMAVLRVIIVGFVPIPKCEGAH